MHIAKMNNFRCVLVIGFGCVYMRKYRVFLKKVLHKREEKMQDKYTNNVEFFFYKNDFGIMTFLADMVVEMSKFDNFDSDQMS